MNAVAGVDDAAGGADAAFIRRLIEAASSPYQRASRFAWFFARGKLDRDPLFADLLRTGAIPDAACLVDLGCGQALLAAWIHAARNAWNERRDGWPLAWPAPPKVATYLGVDQSRNDIARARPAMPAFARVFRGDLRKVGMTMLDRCDVVTLLDVLQYLDPPAQEQLLAAIAKALPPWGVLVLRVGDGIATASPWTNLIDLTVCALRGHPRWRMHQRPVAVWRALLEAQGFVVDVLHDERIAQQRPTRAFANVLLRASRPDADR